jgi:hypothetical protein
MKIRFTAIFFAWICLQTLTVSAQWKSIHPVSQVLLSPKTVQCTSGTLEKVMQAQVGQSVQIQLDAQHRFEGTIQRKSQPYSNLKTVVIKSSDASGAIFQLSQQQSNKTGSKFSGNILYEKADVLLRLKQKGEHYSLEPLSLKKIMPVCKKH